MEPAEIKKMETFLGRLEHVAIRRGLMPEALERVAKAAAALLDVSHLKHKNLKVRTGGSMAKARSPVYTEPREGESGFSRVYMSVLDLGVADHDGAKAAVQHITDGVRLHRAAPRFLTAHLRSNEITQSDLVVNARNSNQHVDTRFKPTESGSLGQVVGIAALEFDVGEVAEGIIEKWLFVRMPGDVFSGSHDLLSGLLVLAGEGYDDHLVAHSGGSPPPLLERAAHGRRGLKHGAAVVGTPRGKPLHVYEMDRNQNPLPVIFSPPGEGYVVLTSTSATTSPPTRRHSTSRSRARRGTRSRWPIACPTRSTRRIRHRAARLNLRRDDPPRHRLNRAGLPPGRPGRSAQAQPDRRGGRVHGGDLPRLLRQGPAQARAHPLATPPRARQEWQKRRPPPPRLPRSDRRTV